MAMFRIATPFYRRTVRALVVAAVLVGVIWLLRDGGREEIRLGFVGTLSGPLSEIARESCDGANLAIAECNEAGGISGRPVRLLIRDDEGNARRIAGIIRDLVSQNVKVAVGPTTPGMAVAAVGDANRLGLLLLSPTVGVDRESPRDNRVASVCPSALAIAEEVTGYMSRHHLRRPAIIADIAYASPGITSSLQRSVPFASESIACTMQYDSLSGVEVTDLISGVLDTHPDCIIVSATPRDTAYFLQHLRRRNMVLPVIAGENSATSTLLSLAGRAAEGLVVVRTGDGSPPSPRLARFRDGYLARYGREPGFAAIHGYDSAKALLRVLSTEESSMLRPSTFTGTSIEGLQGSIVFTDAGDVRRELSCATVRDGAIRSVE